MPRHCREFPPSWHWRNNRAKPKSSTLSMGTPNGWPLASSSGDARLRNGFQNKWCETQEKWHGYLDWPEVLYRDVWGSDSDVAKIWVLGLDWVRKVNVFVKPLVHRVGVRNFSPHPAPCAWPVWIILQGCSWRWYIFQPFHMSSLHDVVGEVSSRHSIPCGSGRYDHKLRRQTTWSQVNIPRCQLAWLYAGTWGSEFRSAESRTTLSRGCPV